VPRVDISWRFQGLDEVIRATRHLPDQAQREIADKREELSQRLAGLVRSAARASSRQSARAAVTVRPGDGAQMVTAGPHPLLFGSNFGILRRTGWYSKHRYINSTERQFRPWIGQGSNDYWFYRTIKAEQPAIDDAWAQALDAIVRAWDA
jgi:hypothetical protein